jgi:hypothetical protein
MKFHFHQLVVPILFIGLLILGLQIHRDYGVSFDEPAQRLIGVTNLNFVAHKFNISSIINNPSLSLFPSRLDQITDRDYGVVFELPAALMEHLLSLNDEREIYFARHLLTFLFFLAGSIAIYRMTVRRFEDWRIGILAITFLILSPRIFADSFYNDKDLVFLSMIAIAMNTTITFIVKPNLKTALINGLSCGLAIDARIMAVIIPILTAGIFLIKTFKFEISIQKATLYLSVFFISCAATTVLFWPFLWEAPLDNFIQAFQNMAKFRHNPYLIFMGESIRASDLPWYYIPLWIGITTPILYLVLFFLGVFAIIGLHIKNKIMLWSTDQELQDLVFLAIFFGPIVAVIFFNSILYNGWRHLYFIYPAFILLSIRGLLFASNYLKRYSFARIVFMFLVSLSCIHTAYWMIKHHPLQNLYFNRFSGDWNRKYEVDYWGLANKQALELILKTDQNQIVKIWPGYGYQWPGGWQLPFTQNLKILNQMDLLRIDIPIKSIDSDYIITSYQGNDGNNTDSYKSSYRYKYIDAILIDKKPVLSIYKRVDNAELPKLSPGSIIKFSKNEAGLNYLDYGWQYPEDWGSWSDGSNARIYIPLQNENVSVIKIKLRALINHLISTQNVEVYIDGKYYHSFSLNQFLNNEISFGLPLHLKKLDLELKFHNAAKPKDLGINNDERVIAIGIESIEIQ